MIPKWVTLAWLASCLAGCQGVIERLYFPTENVRRAEYAVMIDRDVSLQTRDRVPLVADVYHPVTQTHVPTIMVRIPFTNTFMNRFRADAIARYWATRGYHVVVQGTRGRYKSGGTYYPLVNERDDGIDTLTWLAQQSWFNGRLGLWGASAYAYTEWVLADQAHPGPSALDIQICSTSFYDMFYPGGAFSLESALYWAIRSYGNEDRDVSQDALDRGERGFPVIDADNRAVQDVPFFNDWATHTENDDYWRAIDGIDRPKTLKAPALLMAGWFDPFLPSQLRDFAQIRREADPSVAAASRLVIGPWAHAWTIEMPDGHLDEPYRKAVLAPTIDWFDQHLAGRTPATVDTAPITLFVMGDNVWRKEEEWPLTRTVYTALYLRSSGHANSASGDGRLERGSASEQEPPDSFRYDPRQPVPTAGGAMLGNNAGIRKQHDVESRTDVLVYTGHVLDADMEVTGPVKVVLYVATTAPSTDFTAKLVDVHPDGTAYNVSDGILRRAYQEGPTEISIDLWPTSIVFKRGHRIRLEVSSSNYPRYDRNPNTGRFIPTETEPVVARQSIYHAPEWPSRLVLPVIPVED
jgi:putative CocE/NonD family hydrolase